MGLFTPKWKSKDEKKALAYIEKCTDQTLLARIANAPLSSARKEAAIQRLTDQPALHKIAATAYIIGDARLAAEKLMDPALLANLALNARHMEIRRDAVLRLDDQETLQRAALLDTATQVRRCAVQRLERQEILQQIALADADEAVRKAAMERITDPELWQATALASPDIETRLAGVRQLDDQALLTEYAGRDSSVLVRREARTRLADKGMQIELALSDREDRDARIWALQHLPRNDPRLQEYALNDRDYNVKMAAVKRMTAGAMLLETARQSSNEAVAVEAIQRLKQKTDLLSLAKEGRFAKKVLSRLQTLGQLDEQTLIALAALPDGAAAALELDKHRFRTRMTGKGNKAVLAAYDARDVQQLEKQSDLAAVEAAILLLREYGVAKDWVGGPSELAYSVYRFLRRLYQNGDPALRPAIREANHYSVREHGDHGRSGCHNDKGPLIFDFK